MPKPVQHDGATSHEVSLAGIERQLVRASHPGEPRQGVGGALAGGRGEHERQVVQVLGQEEAGHPFFAARGPSGRLANSTIDTLMGEEECG